MHRQVSFSLRIFFNFFLHEDCFKPLRARDLKNTWILIILFIVVVEDTTLKLLNNNSCFLIDTNNYNATGVKLWSQINTFLRRY